MDALDEGERLALDAAIQAEFNSSSSNDVFECVRLSVCDKPLLTRCSLSRKLVDSSTGAWKYKCRCIVRGDSEVMTWMCRLLRRR